MVVFRIKMVTVHTTDTMEAYISGRMKERNLKDSSSSELFYTTAEQSKMLASAGREYFKFLINSVKTKVGESAQIRTFNMHAEHEKIKQSFNINPYLPNGDSMLAFLSCDISQTKTWYQPEISDDSAGHGTHFWHVNVSDFDESQFEVISEEFSSMCWRVRDLFDTSALPVVIQYVALNTETYAYSAKKNLKGKDPKISFPETSERMHIPARLLIGNSNTGVIDIHLGIHPAPTEKRVCPMTFKIDNQIHKFPASLLKFLQNLPVLYSNNTSEEFEFLRSMLHDWYSVDLNLRVFSIYDLAIATGVRAEKLDLCGLSMLIKGEPFPTVGDGMDRVWVRSWKDIPSLCTRYLSRKMLLLTQSFEVLFAAMLRNLFPDPDVVLNVTDMTQRNFINWFSEFMATALLDSQPGHSAANSSSRRGMMYSMNPESKLLTQLSDLFCDVPVLAYGGERYLHNARYCFQFQYTIIKKVHLPGFTGPTPNQAKNIELIRHDLQFGRCLPEEDSGYGTENTGLLPIPQHKHTMYKLDLSESVVVLYPQNRRPLFQDLEEWGRLNHTKIRLLFGQLNELSVDELNKFWSNQLKIYETLRAIFYRMTGRIICVENLEYLVNTKRRNTDYHHQRLEKKRASEIEEADPEGVGLAEAVAIDQGRRVALLDRLRSFNPVDRIGSHQKVLQQLPGENNIRNRKIAAKRKARVHRNMLKSNDPVSVSAMKRLKNRNLLKDRDWNRRAGVKEFSHSRDWRKATHIDENDLRHSVTGDSAFADLRGKLGNSSSFQGHMN